MQLVISLGQMDVHIGEPDRNFERVRQWTEEAARRGSDIVVFPELWDTSYALDRAGELATPIPAGRFEALAALARKHKIHIVGSMLEKRAPDAFYNTILWLTPEGKPAGQYSKIHLFRLMDEDHYLQPGEHTTLLDMPWGKTGLAICYDLRFPEMFRKYAVSGAVIAVLPAQWPDRRIEHWRTLLRARAIENQMVVVACNRVGQEGKARFGGHSAILDAWGQPVVKGGYDEVLLTAAVDLSEVEKVRRQIPVFRDRRPDLY